MQTITKTVQYKNINLSTEQYNKYKNLFQTNVETRFWYNGNVVFIKKKID